ncbi:MAG: hypothetical protein JNJ50_09360 [Acidobacteria bacterium]|nr:hypothetical protein [Acidobacteriota bacterium]
MKLRNHSIVISAMLTLMLGMFSLSLLAQHHDAQHNNAQHNDQGVIHVGKKGEMKLSSPLRVGETLLKPGQYLFKHTMEGDDHVVAFTTTTGNEVARVKCKLEPLDKKAKETAIHTSPGSGGERILTAVQVQGENAKHIL